MSAYWIWAGIIIQRPCLQGSRHIFAQAKSCTIPPCVYTGLAELDKPKRSQHIKRKDILILLSQHFQAPAKRSQHFNATCRNIVESSMVPAFCHLVATCCDFLSIKNRTNAHTRVQHCCMNLAKRPQHHATSTNVTWKIWPFSNLRQQNPT